MKRIGRNGLTAGKAAQRGVLSSLMLGVTMKFGAEVELCGEGEPVEYVYEVVTGAVRTATVLADGRRKIAGFYFAGDMFGFEDANEHALSAEAVVPSTVRVVKRRTLIQLAANDRKLAQDLLMIALHECGREHRHALLLVMTAQERVNSFLVEMMERISIGDLVQLPMSRKDIADYLGLTIETVSRTMAGLAGTSTIHLPNSRTVVLRNRSMLERGTGMEVEMLA